MDKRAAVLNYMAQRHSRESVGGDEDALSRMVKFARASGGTGSTMTLHLFFAMDVEVVSGHGDNGDFERLGIHNSAVHN
jgi:hypothetical protein